MIIVLLVLVTLIAYIGGIYVPNRTVGNWIRAISDVVLIVILFLMVQNDNHHLGMSKVTHVQTTSLASANKQMPMLLYKQLGSDGKEKIYLYKKNSNAKMQHTDTDDTVNQVKVTDGATKLVTKKQVWSYQNNFSKFMFQIAGNDNQHIKTTNTFYINRDWLVLSASQAKKLAQIMQQPAKKQQLITQTQAEVTKKIAAAKAKNPEMSATQQEKLIQKVTPVCQKQVLEKLLRD